MVICSVCDVQGTDKVAFSSPFFFLCLSLVHHLFLLHLLGFHVTAVCNSHVCACASCYSKFF